MPSHTSGTVHDRKLNFFSGISHRLSTDSHSLVHARLCEFLVAISRLCAGNLQIPCGGNAISTNAYVRNAIAVRKVSIVWTKIKQAHSTEVVDGSMVEVQWQAASNECLCIGTQLHIKLAVDVLYPVHT